MTAFVVMQRQPNLPQPASAINATGRFPSLLDCWQQQRNQQSDHADDNQQFDDRKASARRGRFCGIQGTGSSPL